jgi:hypothetical protein
MASLEDRARANVAAQRAADEEHARNAQRQAFDAAQQRQQQVELETPLRARSVSALTELVQIANNHRVPAFELRRAQLSQQRVRRGTYTRMTYELVTRAWVMAPRARNWGSYTTSLAVTEDARIFEFIGCLDRLGGGRKQRTLYLIYNECAKEFHLGHWFDGRSAVDESLRADSKSSLSAWEINPLNGLATFEYYLRPWDPDDLLATLLSDIGAHTGMVAQRSRDSSYTWAEAMAEAAATAILSGMYSLPPAEGGGDSKAIAEQ